MSAVVRPAEQHRLLPLPTPNTPAGAEEAIVSASEIRDAFANCNIDRVAFVRHGNTGKADVDYDRTLTDLGRAQSRIAGASYGAAELRPYYEGAALCSSAPRCVETAQLFLEESLKNEPAGAAAIRNGMPELKLRPELYDGTMQPEGSRLFRSMGYAPLRAYLENPIEDDAEAARCVLGRYALDSLGAIWSVLGADGDHPSAGSGIPQKSTLLFFAHAVYLPSAALALASAIGCGEGIDRILDTNTREAEGYCVRVDARTVALLRRPEV